MTKRALRTYLIYFVLGLVILQTACVSAYQQSLGGDPNHVFDRMYFTDLNTAWQSALEALKNSRIDVSNQEGGFLLTKWTDNTAEKNLSDSFGGTHAYVKAQYRFRVSVAKAFHKMKTSIKVSVQKEQLVQKDILEGWQPIETDSVDETTLLYRIGRIIYIKMKIAKIEEEKTKNELNNP